MSFNRWHLIPHRIQWAVTLPAALSFAFGSCTRWEVCSNPDEVRAEYDFVFFRLLETCGGDWYIKPVNLIPDENPTNNILDGSENPTE